MISVCIPTYNGERFILEQLLSILKQIEITDEVIISDDGSTDSTISIIQSLQDARIKIYFNERSELREKYKFMFTTRNLENALNHAKGDYIFLADQDDIWMDGKVRVILNELNDNLLVLSDCNIIDSSDRVISQSYFKINNSRKGFFKNLFKNSYLGCCMAFRKELLPSVLPISSSLVPHDIWIGLLAERSGTVKFIEKQLVSYRRHSDNVSPSGGKSSNGLFFKMSYRANFITAYFRRVLIKIS